MRQQFFLSVSMMIFIVNTETMNWLVETLMIMGVLTLALAVWIGLVILARLRKEYNDD